MATDEEPANRVPHVTISVRTTPVKPRLDLGEITGHPLIQRNKRRSLSGGAQSMAEEQLKGDTCGGRLASESNNNNNNHSFTLNSTLSIRSACSSPQTPVLDTPTSSPAQRMLAGQQNNNNNTCDLIYRGEFASPTPNKLLANFSISTYLDTPRKTKHCKEF